MKREVGAALAQTAAAAVLWGTSFPVITAGIEGGLNPLLFVSLRFALAAPIMLLITKALGKDTLPLLKSRGVWIVGFLNAVAFLCQFVGQQYTTASVAALLVSLSVVFAAIGGVAFLGEKAALAKVVGVTLALGGTVLITTGGSLSSIANGEELGDVLYLTAAAVWAGYILYAKKETDRRGWDPVAAAACIVAVTAVFVLPSLLAVGRVGAISTTSALAVLYTAGLNTVVPFFLYQRGLRFLSAGSSAVLLTLQVVAALVISAVFLGESFGALAWVGAALVVTSIILVSRVEADRKSLSVRLNDGSRVKDA